MTISMIPKSKVKDLSKKDKKNMHIINYDYRKNLQCVELFTKEGPFKGYGKTTRQSLEKAVNLYKKLHKKKNK